MYFLLITIKLDFSHLFILFSFYQLFSHIGKAPNGTALSRIQGKIWNAAVRFTRVTINTIALLNNGEKTYLTARDFP
jgi:hypothetical protein